MQLNFNNGKIFKSVYPLIYYHNNNYEACNSVGVVLSVLAERFIFSRGFC